MKEVRFVLSAGDDDGEIASKLLKVKWNQGIETDLKEFHNLKIKDAIAEMVLETIQKSITLDVVKELLEDVDEVCNE